MLKYVDNWNVAIYNIGVYVDISGIFSEGKQGYIYITLYDNSDDEDFRFEEITFKSPLSHFEICEENIIDLIVSSTDTIEIVLASPN